MIHFLDQGKPKNYPLSFLLLILILELISLIFLIPTKLLLIPFLSQYLLHLHHHQYPHLLLHDSLLSISLPDLHSNSCYCCYLLCFEKESLSLNQWCHILHFQFSSLLKKNFYILMNFMNWENSCRFEMPLLT